MQIKTFELCKTVSIIKIYFIDLTNCMKYVGTVYERDWISLTNFES